MSSTDISKIINHIDNFGRCSPEQYQEYLKMLSMQNSFSRQLEVASLHIDALSIEFEETKEIIFAHRFNNPEKAISDVHLPNFFSAPGWDFKI